MERVALFAFKNNQSENRHFLCGFPLINTLKKNIKHIIFKNPLTFYFFRFMILFMRGILYSFLICFSVLFSIVANAALNSETSDAIDYSEVDAYAKNAPEFKKMPDLVKYLITPYKKNELFKARALFIWIASHVQYDMYKYSNIVQRNKGGSGFIKNADVYQTRLGVCGDFADLFNKMARKAHLESETVVGIAGYGLTPETAPQYPHAWNAVKIDKKWHIIDVTWALDGQYAGARNIHRPKDYKKLLKNRKKDKTKESFGIEEDRPINDFWFLPPPEKAIESHFPHRIKWQLLKHPVTPRRVWRDNKRMQKQQAKKMKKKK